MHLSPIIILTTSAFATASAQVIFNTTTDQFVCPSTPPNGTYCTSPSLTSNIIIRCTGTEGFAGNCNDNLADVPPFGLKFAPCYESSPTAADAACSYNGTVYPDNGLSFPIPIPIPVPTNINNTTAPTSAITSVKNVSASSSALSKDILTPTTAPTPISALYPMPSATNATATHANATAAAATATGSGIGIVIAPSKTGALAPTFAGSAAGRSFVGGDVVAVAVAAVVGSMLLLL